MLYFQIRNDVGRCLPLTAAYGSVHNAVCVQTIDGVVSIVYIVVHVHTRTYVSSTRYS